MNSTDQHRNATVNGRLDALVKSASEFADATVERFDELKEEKMRVRADLDKLTASLVEETTRLDCVDAHLVSLISEENQNHARGDEQIQRILKRFMTRGFWSRLNWLVTGR